MLCFASLQRNFCFRWHACDLLNGCSVPHSCKFLQPGVAALILHQGLQQIPEGIVGPECVAEHQQGKLTLPEEKVAEAVLARGTNQQIDGRAALRNIHLCCANIKIPRGW